MTRTRNSLYYLAGYLYFAGVGFLVLPSAMLTILFSEGIYSMVTLRLLGGQMLAIAILTSKIIEGEITALYRQLILARIPVLVALAYIYYDSLDRMWMIMLAIVLVGWLYSVISYALDRRDIRVAGSS